MEIEKKLKNPDHEIKMFCQQSKNLHDVQTILHCYKVLTKSMETFSYTYKH